MAAFVSPPCTTRITDSLCVFPACYAVPRSIIRYQRAKWPSIYLEHELPVQHVHIYIYNTYILPVPIFQVGPLDSSGPPGVFYKYFYNHAHRPRLEKLFYIELSRSSSGYFKPLLDPGGGFNSETAALQNGYKFITAICNGHSPTDTIFRSGVTVM
jgi:hypothetical protein